MHQGVRDHQVVRKLGLGFRKTNHYFTVVVLVYMALGSGL